MSGFATESRSGIELQIGQVARIDFVLKVGSVSEVVEVAGGAPVLQTETTEMERWWRTGELSSCR